MDQRLCLWGPKVLVPARSQRPLAGTRFAERHSRETELSSQNALAPLKGFILLCFRRGGGFRVRLRPGQVDQAGVLDPNRPVVIDVNFLIADQAVAVQVGRPVDGQRQFRQLLRVRRRKGIKLFGKAAGIGVESSVPQFRRLFRQQAVFIFFPRVPAFAFPGGGYRKVRRRRRR